MRRRGAGAIVNISSIAARTVHASIAYKTSKAAVIALTQQIAIQHAADGIRANVILPGLMNTPTAIEGLEQATGMPRATIVAERDARVPLRGGMGSAWDVAHAALFLASDDARFVTGAVLPVDGGTTLRVG
jgi:NAD(P)-dependent dehydrogenase (short-subunit alcohol dehydrogenase family)